MEHYSWFLLLMLSWVTRNMVRWWKWNKCKTDDIWMSNWMLIPLADISLKVTIEMMFGQDRLGWSYSFVKWRTWGRRRGGDMPLHMTIHYAAVMCVSACEMDQSYSTGQVMQHSDVWCLYGFVLRLTAGREYTICNVLITFTNTRMF